ncbi:MAG: YbaK/EbsC family protein [Hyphomicrobiales bacterium]
MTDSSDSGMAPANLRVAEGARKCGLDINIQVMGESTRTAVEAAAACGCSVGQIVKSLVFRGVRSGKPYLLLVSGSNRVDEKGVAATLGEPLERPDAAFVREVTGYAIGGVPPLAHAMALAAYMDKDLLQYDVVWAAAGTPRSIFPAKPSELAKAANANVIRVA